MNDELRKAIEKVILKKKRQTLEEQKHNYL